MTQETVLERKILVPVDGSPHSFNALRYIKQLFTGQPNIKFHLLTIVTCESLSAGKEWLEEIELLNTLSPQTRKRYSSAKRYMKKAEELMMNMGFSPKQLSSEVILSRVGVSQDILQLGRKGLYDAILIGRRGLSKLEELVMGSISQTLIEEDHDVPFWLVDGKVDSRKFLVPVDGTPHSLKSLDHLAFILKDNPNAEITLFHSSAMFANQCVIEPEHFYGQWGTEWCNLHLSGSDSLFHAPEQLLIENGFPANKIYRINSRAGFEPAQQILRQALVHDFGTIVIGRRSKNVHHKGIFRGVSDRVMFMADQVSVWIVG
jgi:nucleotide-binding universal stress UspA family protein